MDDRHVGLILDGDLVVAVKPSTAPKNKSDTADRLGDDAREDTTVGVTPHSGDD